MRPPDVRVGQYRVLILLITLAQACAWPTHRVSPGHPAEAGTALDALAARERAMRSLRVSMTLRSPGMSPAALIPTRAYLATESPDRLRLQVLSPFGTTTCDLTIAGDRYELHLPLTGEVKRGGVTPEALAATEAPQLERMVIALALLFRPKVSRERCSRDPAGALTCRAAEGLVARITVDKHLRPLRENYLGIDGTPLLKVKYGEYAGSGPNALPGRIEIRDQVKGTKMVARVLDYHPGALQIVR